MRDCSIKEKSIAVLTPYAAQKHKIQELLKKKNIHNIRVLSIVESQGIIMINKRRVIVLCACQFEIEQFQSSFSRPTCSKQFVFSQTTNPDAWVAYRSSPRKILKIIDGFPRKILKIRWILGHSEVLLLIDQKLSKGLTLSTI